MSHKKVRLIAALLLTLMGVSALVQPAIARSAPELSVSRFPTSEWAIEVMSQATSQADNQETIALQELLKDDDRAAMGRSFTSDEKALQDIPNRQEALVAIVGKDNPFNGSLTIEQFTQIFQGKITDWSEVGGAPGTLWLVDRPKNSDTRLALSRSSILGAPRAAETKLAKAASVPTQNALPIKNVIRLETDDTTAVIRQLGKDGIGYAIASQLVGQTNVRVIDFAAPALPKTSPSPIVAPVVPVPEAQVPKTQIPEAQIPEAQLPKAQIPEAQVPEAQIPEDAEPSRSLPLWWLLPLLLVGFQWLRRRVSPESTLEVLDAPPIQTEPALEVAAPLEDAIALADPVVLLSQGETLLAAGRYEEAIPLFDEAVKIQPDLQEAWIARGQTLLKLERLEEALTSFNQATELNANLPEAWIGKGDVLTKLGLPNEAQASYQRVTVAEIDGVISQVTLEVTSGDTSEVTSETVADVISSPAIAPVAPLAIVDQSLEVVLPDSSPEISFKQAFLDNLSYLGKSQETATPQDLYSALASLVRDRLQLDTPETYLKQGDRLVGEFSAEYLPGLHLASNLLNSDLTDSARQATQELGISLDELLAQEEESGLGRGGLGRLMVCYLEALATAKVPAIGYGIRYEYGIFDQEISNGWQIEVADEWLRKGNPWEVERPELDVQVQFGGRAEAYLDGQNAYRVRWIAGETVRGIPYDTPIPGYKSSTVSLLRLWKAEAAENFSKVLYPSDTEFQGKLVRLKQQFFFVSCSLQDIIRMHLETGGTIATLPDRFALQLNDTDPLIAIAELMRLLIDEQNLTWDQAWQITQSCFAYTNHSLLPEALDYTQYALPLVGALLPRHLEIILEINARFLEEVRSRFPGDEDRVQRMSLIDERGDRYVRMLYLACLGSHAVNGVSALNTAILQHLIIPDFYELYPEKFSTKTNGVSPRRFLALSNPRLSELIASKIGEGWITDLQQLSGLEAFADDPEFRGQWRQAKQGTKQALADTIQQQSGIAVDVNSLFDVQAIEIHEHKRQHLNLLHIITLYNRLKANPQLQVPPRTFIFSGKAAPDYSTAKLIIKLINAVAEVINADPVMQGRIKVVFLKDFTIQLSQQIYPATDLAEYISTAGTEACGIGNMITVMNGGLLIGTRDGSNLEIRDAIGTENFFQFGLTVNDILAQRSTYNPSEVYNTNPELKQAIDQIAGGTFSNGDTELFQPLIHLMLHWDAHLLLADYASYIASQEQVSQAYADSDRWTRMTILSAARMGRFSADRAVQEYCQDTWGIFKR